MNENYMYNQNNNYQNYNTNQTYNNTQNSSKKLLCIIIMLLLVIIISIIAILMKGNVQKSFSRTIMVYMVGSNLESEGGFGTLDLDAIDYQTITDHDVNVLVIAGGTPKWHNDYIDKTETSIYKLEEDGFKKVKAQDKISMGKSETLSNFMSYVYDNYKTDKYELILWNHGGAIDGSEYDDLFKKDNLTLKELHTALEDSPFNEKNKLELVFFNTCLNGTIEMTNVFKDYADYLVASEEVTYGTQLASEFNFINKIEPKDSEVEIGKKIIDAYKGKIQALRDYDDEYANAIYSTYSLVKLSKIDDLNKEVSEFFKDIDISENFYKISKARANLFQYGTDIEEYDMVDLYNLVDELKDISPNKAQKVLDTLEKTITYNWATDKRSRGLSIYFPYKGKQVYKEKFIKVYDNLSSLSDYHDFIKEFNTLKIKGYNGKVAYANNEISINEDSKTGKSDFEMELTDEQEKSFASAEYVVYRKNENGFYKPIYSGAKAEIKGNKLTANIRNRQLKVVSTDDPKDDMTLLTFEKDENDKYITYETNVLLQNYSSDKPSEWLNDHGIMKILFDKETQKVEILGTIYDSKDEELVNNSFVDMSKYTSVAFSASSGWKILDDEGNYIGPQINPNGGVVGDGVITGFEEAPGKFKFELEDFADDYEYYAVFIITDIYGNKSYTKLVKMN